MLLKVLFKYISHKVIAIISTSTLAYFIFKYAILDYFTWIQFVCIFILLDIILEFIDIHSRINKK